MGDDAALLTVLRGNSGSGKSTTARALRRVYPRRFVWIEQDNVRRMILDEVGAASQPLMVDMIDRCARLSLCSGRDVIIEGHPRRRPLRRHAGWIAR